MIDDVDDEPGPRSPKPLGDMLGLPKRQTESRGFPGGGAPLSRPFRPGSRASAPARRRGFGRAPTVMRRGRRSRGRGPRAARVAALRGRLQRDDRRVEHLLDQRARQLGYDRALLGRQRREPAVVPLDLARSNVVQMLVRARRSSAPSSTDLTPTVEDDDLDVEHPPRLVGGAAPLLEPVVDDPLQVVDVVEVDPGKLVDRRLDVARHRDVHDEQRAARAAPEAPGGPASSSGRASAPRCRSSTMSTRVELACVNSSHGSAVPASDAASVQARAYVRLVTVRSVTPATRGASRPARSSCPPR